MKKIIFFLLLAFFLRQTEAQDLTAGLIGYYSFCGCDAQDHSGVELHGTIVGNPECIQGIKGEGFYFNRSGGRTGCATNNTDFIQLPLLQAAWDYGISICAWVEFENRANFERIVDFGNGDGDSGGLPIWFGREGNSDNLALESWINSDPNFNRTTGRLVARNAITNGRIEFYCATIAGDTMSIYVNGELVAQKRGNPVANVDRNRNYIGRSNWCVTDPDFQGFMDEVRIYRRALSAEEIRQLYESPFLTSENSSNTICAGDSLQLRAQGGESYEWSPGNGLSATNIANPIAAPQSTTQYICTIRFADGCSIQDTILVKVAPPKEITIDKIICEGDVYEGYMETGQYIDRFTTRDGCDSTRVLNLEVVPIPTLSETRTICSGESYDGYSSSGIYQDTLPRVAGCDTIRTLELRVLPGPTIINLMTSPASCGQTNGSLRFTSEGGTGDRAVFLNGMAISSTDLNGTLSAGAYQLMVEDESGCRFDTTVIITQEECDFFVPNVFSPNGDGVNDVFQVFSGSGYSVTIKSYRIFDRWGALMYEADNFPLESSGQWWNGRSNGQIVDKGVYVYFVEIERPDGVVERLSGEVMVVR